MTSPSFPSYASIMLNGYEHQRESALLRTTMESGPPKQARIRSRVMVTKSCIIKLKSLNDFESFEQWYANDLNEGALWFTYFDPISELIKTARFVDGGFKATPMASAQGSWTIQMKIESWGS